MRPPTSDIENRLTQAGREALDELTREYRSDLLLLADQIAGRSGEEDPEISVRDVVVAVETLRSRPGVARTAARSESDRKLTAILYVGGFIGFLGLFAFTFGQWVGGDFEPQFTTPTVGLLVGLGGFYVAFIAWFLQRYARSRSRRRLFIDRALANIETMETINFNVVQSWRHLELLLRELAAEYIGESASSGSISTIVETLVRAEALAADHVPKLTKLLHARNSILHERRMPPRSELVGALRDSADLVSALERRRERLQRRKGTVVS